MRNFRILVLTALSASFAAAALAQPVPIADDAVGEGRFLTDWVSRLAGAPALSCHANKFALDQSAAIDCAERAITDSRPFWVTFEEVGLDYGGWRGFARNGDGQMWMVSYDFGSSMKNMERPKAVSVVTCKRLYIEGAKIRCEEL